MENERHSARLTLRSCSGLPSVLRSRLLILMMLLVVALLATPSKPIPTYLDHGSAFSASSAEVALPNRRDIVGDVRIVPAPPKFDHEIQWHVAGVPPIDAHTWPVNHQTDPPKPRPRLSDASPRAPPVS